MYKVVTISKKTGIEEGYLGEYDTQEEANDIAYRFNLKADRHPSIAKVVQNEEENEEDEEDQNYFNDFFNNPRQKVESEDEIWDFEEQDTEESSEESSSDGGFDLSFDETPSQQRYRNTQRIERPVQRRVEQKIEPYRNPQQERKINSFTQLQSQKSSERIKSRNKKEMQYNKDRFMFRDVGSNSSISSIRKSNTKPFMFSQIQHSIRGIIISKNKVLIREPANHYDNVVWEFYGGTPEKNETEEETVKREVREETGYDTRVIKYVGDYTYKNRVLKFYLLEKIGTQQAWHGYETTEEETWSTKWVTKEQAWNYFKLNKNELYKRLLRNALDEAFHKYKLINMR